MSANPWSLTPREAQVMDAFLACGEVKRVASRLKIGAHTVVQHMREVRRKMNPPHKLGHFLMWHEWRRENDIPAGGVPVSMEKADVRASTEAAV